MLLLVLSVITGCTHVQLQRDTVRQSLTLTELYQQQVVDNLALFAHDPDALPHFLYAKEGSSQVVDTGGTTFGIDWGRSGVNKTSLGLSGMRQLNETWTLEPINDPRKLALMRCAYQTALANCGMGQVSQSCPDCQKRFDDFYGKGHVPKRCDCLYVGHYYKPTTEANAVKKVTAIVPIDAKVTTPEDLLLRAEAGVPLGRKLRTPAQAPSLLDLRQRLELLGPR